MFGVALPRQFGFAKEFWPNLSLFSLQKKRKRAAYGVGSGSKRAGRQRPTGSA
jgi:hypothetical protein